MKGKYLLPLLVSIILILILVATSCTPTTTTSTPTQTTSKPAATTSTPTTTTKVEYRDTIYRVLNPIARDLPRDIAPLAPRIDSLAGKKIAFCMAEGSPVVMPALWERIKKEFPTTTWVYTESRQTSPIRLTAEEEKGVQAMIVGNTW